MLRARIAEWLLTQLMPAERATTIVGDLLEGSAHGSAWRFTADLARVVLAELGATLQTRGAGFLWGLLKIALACVLFGAVFGLVAGILIFAGIQLLPRPILRAFEVAGELVSAAAYFSIGWTLARRSRVTATALALSLFFGLGYILDRPQSAAEYGGQVLAASMGALACHCWKRRRSANPAS